MWHIIPEITNEKAKNQMQRYSEHTPATISRKNEIQQLTARY